MRAVFALLLVFVAAAFAQSYPNCAWNGGQPHLPSPPLTECPNFASMACCNSSETDILHTSFTTMVQPLFGSCPNCVTAFETLWCTYVCSPNQGTFVDFHGWNSQGQAVTTFRMCNHFCNSFYSACGDVDMGGVSVKQLFPSAQAFCQYSTYTQPITIVLTDDKCLDDPSVPTTCK